MTHLTHADSVERVQRILAPASIAIVGASERAGPGRKVLDNLLMLGFTGPIYPINRTATSVAGCPAYRSLSELPTVPELVVVAVNRAATVPVVAEAAHAGCAGAVLLAAGFDETGDGGSQLSAQVSAARGAINLIGPNCLGFANLADRVAAYSGPLPEPAETGTVGLISNSGAMACSLTGAAAERRIGFSHLITTGNQLDLGVADFVSALAAAPTVRVIACYLEGFQNGRRLLDAFRAAATTGKIIIVLKSGRSAAGGEAAKTHTGVLAGSAPVQNDLFTQHGVLMASDPDEFLALIELASRTPRPPTGTLVGAVTISGGERLLLADYCEEFGIPLASLSPATTAAITATLPPYATATNPLDTTGAGIIEGDSSFHAEAVASIANDPNVGLLLACQDAKNAWVNATHESQVFLDAVQAATLASDSAGIPLIVISPTSGEVDNRARRYLQENAVPCLSGMRPGMSALAKYLGSRAINEAAPRIPTRPLAQTSGGARLDGRSVIERLAAHQITHWPTRFVHSAEQAQRAGQELSYPVALKLEAGIAHRKALDGIRLGLRNSNEIEKAWQDLATVAKSRGIDAQEMSVQPMAIGTGELFIGALVDAQFGPIVLLGPGGTDVERSTDIAVGLAPVATAHAESLITRAACNSMIPKSGADGGAIRRKIAEVLSAVSHIITEHDVQAVDLNPIILLQDQIAIVDAKIVTARTHGG